MRTRCVIRCEDVKMICGDVKMRRCEEAKVICEDVKMECVDVDMRR